MNTYIAFHKGHKMTVYGRTSYEAQQKAALAFRAKKSYNVSVVLVEKEDGAEVYQSPDAL
jgi:hypothetical protein